MASIKPLPEDKTVPIKGVQRLMVKSMQAASSVQHLTLGEEVSLDKLVNLRKELKVEAERTGIKLSYMPFIIKAVSIALTEYPLLNATVNAECTEMVYHASHNIGVAMDTPSGLVVPVVRDVNAKSLFDIAEEMGALQKRAIEGKLKEADFKGGTFFSIEHWLSRRNVCHSGFSGTAGSDWSLRENADGAKIRKLLRVCSQSRRNR